MERRQLSEIRLSNAQRHSLMAVISVAMVSLVGFVALAARPEADPVPSLQVGTSTSTSTVAGDPPAGPSADAQRSSGAARFSTDDRLPSDEADATSPPATRPPTTGTTQVPTTETPSTETTEPPTTETTEPPSTDTTEPPSTDTTEPPTSETTEPTVTVPTVTEPTLTIPTVTFPTITGPTITIPLPTITIGPTFTIGPTITLDDDDG